MCSYGSSALSVSSSSAFSNPDSYTPPRPDTAVNNFPAVYFLDSSLFRRTLERLPSPAINFEDGELQDFVGDIFADNAFVSKYFDSVHPWFSFLSKRMFMGKVLNPLGQPQPGSRLLIAAMKLIIEPVGDGGPQTAAYRCIKDVIHRAETSNVLTFRVFQALVLVALYEIGHAIYPAAFLTVGGCVRYGTALDINKSIDPRVEATVTSSEAEEERRAWWAVLILDRLVLPLFPIHSLPYVPCPSLGFKGILLT